MSGLPNYPKDHNIQPVYQPIVDLVDYDILGYEALARVNGKAPLNLLRESYQEN